MLVMNNQKRTVHIGEILLLPGSNIVKDGTIDEAHPIIKALSVAGKISFEHNINPSVAAMAISRATTRDVVSKIEKSVKKTTETVKKAAAARRQQLDEFDAEWEDARKKQNAQKETAGAI